MNAEIMRDIVEWDFENWSRAIGFWEEDAKKILADFSEEAKPSVLDIGGRNGGLSLYWALNGCRVLWSDINEEGLENAKQLHAAYQVADKVQYEIINSLDIPYEEQFDIVCFKSVLGALDDASAATMLSQIHKALKPGGHLFFVENLCGTKMHMFLRRKLRRWGNEWHYRSIQKTLEMLEGFQEVRYDSFGLIGILGRTKALNRLFGAVDKRFDHKMAPDKRYIISLVCKKQI